MKNIQPFIDLGIHTVPLDGQLKRLDDGTKTTPSFEKDWKAKYQSVFNDKATKLGGAITGAISNIIAIDCDDQATYDIFQILDNNNTFHFVSERKPKGGGTVIYKYPTGVILESFSLHSPLLNLDFYSDNGFIYLPSRANETKKRWEYTSYKDLPVLHEAPETVLKLLLNFQLQYTLAKGKAKETNDKNPMLKIRFNYLAPQVELLVSKKAFIPSLFRIITPKDFRELPQYKQHGYLHPNNVPEGRGSEYLMKVSAILGADPSISKDVYLTAMGIINSLWDSPVVRTKFEATIINPMLEGRANVNGEAIWQYDEHWKTRGLAFTTKLGEAVEVFYDDVRACYYFINYTSDMIKQFYKESLLFEYIEPIAAALPARKELKSTVPVVRTTLEPTLPFGFFSEDDYNRQFNMFKQTPALAILNEPESYKELYNRPNTILSFIESFIPDLFMRNYILGFLKRKMTSFKYSPVILYFLGSHGSGKDTFINILAQILGENYIARPSAKEFLEQFNGWVVDKYFVQLDEYGNQLHSLFDKETALGKIKSYSGKPQMQIRQMRTDGFPYNHVMTIIISANSNPLMLEDGDRRVALIETPNILKDESWVHQLGGITAVIDKMQVEVNDFCYYLATEVNAVAWDEYMTPPETDSKRDIIASKLPAANRLAYYFKHSMFEQLEDVIEESGLHDTLLGSIDGKLYEDKIFDLYSYMTEGRGTKRGLTKVLREYDYEKIPTSRKGVKLYYYHINTLRYYKPSLFADETIELDL